jgi:hypothetical protein
MSKQNTGYCINYNKRYDISKFKWGIDKNQ